MPNKSTIDFGNLDVCIIDSAEQSWTPFLGKGVKSICDGQVCYTEQVSLYRGLTQKKRESLEGKQYYFV